MGAAFWTSRRRRFWMVCGVLIALAGGSVATVYLVASRPDSAPRQAAKGELSAFLSSQHKAAIREGGRLDWLPVTDAASLPEHEWVGRGVSFESVFPGGGVTFVSAGKSAVPGAGASAQWRVRVGDSVASVFVKQYRKAPELEDGGAYTLAGRNLGEGAPPITVWRRGELVFFLVADNGSAMGAMRDGMRAPEPKKAY